MCEWGRVCARHQRKGRRLAVLGSLAATALAHDLILVTRNTVDYPNEIPLLNAPIFFAKCKNMHDHGPALETKMYHREHRVHGVQTTEGPGLAQSHKAKGGLTQTRIAHKAFRILYLPPSVLSVSSVVNSYSPF